MAVLLGALVAFGFGAGDFVGGRAAMDSPMSAVLVVSQLCSVLVALVLALLVGARVASHDIALGLLAGGANVAGLGLLYRGLATGTMSVVAPVTAVVAATIPVGWGAAHGERPSTVVLFGVALAISAGPFVAHGEGEVHGGAARRATLVAVCAGVALGSSLILYAETGSASGMWPVLAARASGFVLVAAGATVVARGLPKAGFATTRSLGFAVGAGLFDVAAAVLLLVAVRRDLLIVVSPVASLAPAVTVVLAWRFLGERLHRMQQVGLAIALVGLVLVAAG